MRLLDIKSKKKTEYKEETKKNLDSKIHYKKETEKQNKNQYKPKEYTN